MLMLGELVLVAREATETRSRKRKVALLAAVLERLTPDEVPVVVRFLSGELRQGKLGLGYAELREALNERAPEGATMSALDLDVAVEELSRIHGAGRGTERRLSLAQLFARLTSDERDYVSRLVTGEMRHGVGEGLVLDALCVASGIEPRVIEQALLFLGDLSRLGTLALVFGQAELERQSVELFRPLRPMLAQTSTSVEAAFAKTAPCAIEHKLDGARIQVHRSKERVAIYSRTGNDVTTSLPELVALALSFPAESFVLDGEAIALRANGRPESFQTTMRRFGRKTGVADLVSTLPLHAYFFDCLLLNGAALVAEGNARRFEALSSFVPAASRVARTTVENAGAAAEALDRALAQGHEGVVIKKLDSLYEAGRRGGAWLKVKPAPTLDLVVLAAEWGSGRRKGYLSNLHLGARDPRGEGFVMLGKTFKGLTDATLAWQTNKLQDLATEQRGHVVYVRPELVVEIAFDGVQESRVYDGGFTLRFARLKRYRDDKSASEADTIDTVRELYEKSRA